MTTPTPGTLSKSRYLAGMQCSKRLWTEVRDPASIPPRDAATQARFDQGHHVGSVARELFPGGIEVDHRPQSWEDLEAATRRALTAGVPLFEPAFVWQGVGCRVDILVPGQGGSWSVFEVKSSTGVKDIHIDDLALQAFVLEGCGLDVSDYFLVHLDNSYCRSGALDLEDLFVRSRVTEAVRSRRAEVVERVEEMSQVVQRADRPVVPIGPHCDSPYPCPLKPQCWSFLPAGSVVDLARDRRLGFELLSRGILELADIPDTLDLDPRQRIQLATVRSGREHVDAAALKAFLEQLKYPISYFDIETFAPAIPQFDQSRPYQQIPFLFSVHRVEEPAGEARHFAHLVEPGNDPRPDFLRAALASLGEKGSIVAYNAGFERRILSETVEDLAIDRSEVLRAIEGRFVDLLQPFRSFAYHHPDQLGSASLKAVLGPLTGLTYDELEIADGETASRQYYRLQDCAIDPRERRRVLRQLVDYCSLDTLGMVAIVDRLRRLALQGAQSDSGGVDP